MAGVNDMSGATRTKSQIRQAVEGDSTVAFTQATTISTTTGNLTLNPSGDTVISGNLTVNGTTANVSTTNTVIEDKIIEIGNGTSGTPSGDAGIIIERGSSTNAAIIWDESRDEFVLGTTSATGASTGDLTVTPGNVSVERIGAGTEQAEAEVHAKRDASSGGTYSSTAGIISEDDSRPAIQLVGSANNIGMIQFGDNAAAASGQLYYDHSTDKLRVDAGGSTDRVTVDSSGNVVAAGAVTATGFTIGNAAMSEAELETIDGVTAGTVAASKAVVVDANKDIGSFRNITLTGELDAGSLDISGDADIDGTLEADAYTVNGQTLAAYIAAVSVDAATLATTFTCTDNENANEDCPIVFVDGATGAQGAETDGDLHYNPSTGTVTATVFKGNVDAVDGDFDGTLEADAITVGGTALDEFIADTVGAMVGSNTESGITVAYQDADNTLDFTVGTLNQDTTGTAAIATTVTVADESSDTSCNVLFATAATGNLAPKSGTNLTFNSSDGTLTASNLAGTITTASQTNITGVGTIGTGTWQGTAIASAYLDADTAHLSGTQTFSGAKTFTAAVTVGANDAGHDVILYGDTASANVTWDTSEDDLIFNGAARAVVPDGQLVLGSTAVSSTAAELNVLDGLNRGHIIVGNASNAPTSLAEGSENQVLTIDANGDAVWAAGGGGTFPGSATDNALTRFNGTGGSTVQNSGALLDDSNNLTTPGNITVGGGTAADHYFAIDGNAADWRVGVDDSADLLEIGSGTTAGANVALAVNSDGQITTRRLEVAKKTADYDLVFGTDHVILVDTSGGEYDISLPHATAEMDGHTYIIKDINDCSVNNIIIDLADSGDKIEGTTNGTYVMNSPRESVTVLVRWIAAGGGFGDHFII